MGREPGSQRQAQDGEGQYQGRRDQRRQVRGDGAGRPEENVEQMEQDEDDEEDGEVNSISQ